MTDPQSTPAEHRRRQDALRQRRMRDNGPVERFTRTEIGDRDGWVCGLCLDPIDRSYRYPDPRSPSLDHIWSIAGGGTHTRDNVRITHWGCNHERNADDGLDEEAAEAVAAFFAEVGHTHPDGRPIAAEDLMRAADERNRPEVYRQRLTERVADWEAKENLVFEVIDAADIPWPD